jgi:transcriptional regulator with XRE-family HTH domain
MGKVEFGVFLKAQRNKKGITLEALGEKVQLSKSYLSHIENGKREIPSPDILRKMANALGIEYEELMIKAGYWNEKFDEGDRALFEDIYNDQRVQNNQISKLLKLIADDDGLFPDYLHKDIFKIFGGWLSLGDGIDSSFKHDQWYLNNYLNEPEEDFRESELKGITDDFNRIYNYTTIKYGIIEYNGFNKDRRDFLKELLELIDKHDLVNINSRLDENDLTAFLQRSDITYGTIKLDESDRNMIDALVSVYLANKNSYSQ